MYIRRLSTVYPVQTYVLYFATPCAVARPEPQSQPARPEPQSQEEAGPALRIRRSYVLGTFDCINLEGSCDGD